MSTAFTNSSLGFRLILKSTNILQVFPNKPRREAFLLLLFPWLLLFGVVFMPFPGFSQEARPGVSIRQIAIFNHAQVSRLSWSPDGRYLATAGLAGLVNWLGVVGDKPTTAVWDVKEKRLVTAGHRFGTGGLTVLIGQEPILLTAYYDAPEDPEWRRTKGFGSLFSLAHARTGAFIQHMPGAVPIAVPSYNALTNVFAGIRNEKIHFYDTRKWEVKFSLPVPEAITVLEFSPNGRKIAFSQFPNIEIYDLEEKRTALVFKPSNFTIFGLAWSPDGNRLALLEYGGGLPRPDHQELPGGMATFKIWDAKTGGFIRAFPDLKKFGAEAGRPNLSWSADGRFIATVTQDRTVRLWSPDHEVELARVAPEDKGHFAVAFSPTENVLAVATTKAVVLYAIR